MSHGKYTKGQLEDACRVILTDTLFENLHWNGKLSFPKMVEIAALYSFKRNRITDENTWIIRWALLDLDEYGAFQYAYDQADSKTSG